MSPLLLRLDQKLRVSKDARSRAELKTKQAGYYARIGNFVAAKSIITELRREFGDGHNGRITVCIMISEALIHHYENLSSNALDRIIRAQFISRLINDSQLEAISSAWRAHIEFDSSKFEEMFVSLRCAIDKVSPSNYDALARVSNIICKVAILCGATDIAKEYFKIGREHALREGDQAGIEAIQHNKAAFRLSRIRSMRCLGDIDAREVIEVRVEIETARSLQNLVRVTALASYIDLCHARLLIMEDRFQEAVDCLIEIKDHGPYPVGSFAPEVIDMEVSYCYGVMGNLDKALLLFERNKLEHLKLLDPDERLVVRWMQLQLALKDYRFGDIDASKAAFDSSVIEYIELMKKLQKNINGLSII